MAARAPAPFVQQWRPRAERRLTGWTTMKLLFVADPLETFKTYKDTTFAMIREAARAATRCWRASRATWCGSGRPRRPRRCATIALAGDEQRTGSSRPRRRRRSRCRRRRDADAQGPAVRQRVLLRDAPARAGRTRRRAVFNEPRALRDHPGEARDPRVPAVHRADHGHARRRRDPGASTPSTATSS